MSTEERFDAIVVGAGPAGSVAAYCLAKAGLEVLLVERGNAPGSKNMTGGRLYGHSLEKVIPGFWEEAPVERRIVNETITFLTGESAVSLDVKSKQFAQAPSFTVLRSEFDSWLAGKAEEAGAMLACGVRVDELLRQEGKVMGIRSDEDEMLADVVIAADGVNSILAQKADIRGELPAKHVATGVKEVIELPRQVIEDRFHLTEQTGAAQLFVGECTRGMQGGGFLYTNHESISLGLVITAEEFADAEERIVDLVEEFKMHPLIQPLIEGGQVVEYSAHLVPEGGLNMMPSLCHDGLLIVGDAAGLVLNTGYMVRGMDLAIASGEAAANAVIAAKAGGDFSKQGLSSYQTALENSFVLQDMKTYAKAPKFMENHRIFGNYPGLMEEMMVSLFSVNGNSAQPVRKSMLTSIKRHGGFMQLAKDAWKGMRAV
ncbi:electron transfer flavoprotein-ubiquinone oxidoreductase [Peptococcaceae bacterium CEB3]|nr:electron transfer flavoprotein-ubiquinone oxidoreductase [Peptococcaceae bacterium CEB3]